MKHIFLGLMLLTALPAFAESQGPSVDTAPTIAYVNPLPQRAWFLPQSSPAPAIDKIVKPETATPTSPAASQEPVKLPANLESDER